jgi:hypothetical protein
LSDLGGGGGGVDGLEIAELIIAAIPLTTAGIRLKLNFVKLVRLMILYMKNSLTTEGIHHVVSVFFSLN